MKRLLNYPKGYLAGVLAAGVVVFVIRLFPMVLHRTQPLPPLPLVGVAIALLVVIAAGALIPFVIAVWLAYMAKLSHWSYFAVWGLVAGGLFGPIVRLMLPGSALDDQPSQFDLKSYVHGLWTIGPTFAVAGLVAGVVYWYVGRHRHIELESGPTDLVDP